MRLKLLFPLFTITLGCLVFAGWFWDVHDLRRLGTSLVPMNPVSDLGFIFIAFNLLALNFISKYPKTRFLCFAMLALSISASGIKLWDLSFGTTWNVDGLLFPNLLLHEPTFPNQMAPNTALILFLLGLSTSLLYSRSKKLTLAAQLLAIISGFMALFATIGYAYRVEGFYGVKTFTPMSLSAATFSILLACSALLTSPHAGFMRFISNKGPSGHMARVLMPASVILPFGLGFLRLIGQQAGFYGLEYGTALLVAFNIITLFVMIFFCAVILHQTNLKRVEAEKVLEYQAGHDPLTGLVNRRLFAEQLKRRLNFLARKPTIPFAVFYIDLDGFKNINDKFGHESGDAVLVNVAKILRECSRASDTIARLGGDEFAILYEEFDHMDNIAVLANRLLKAASQSFGPHNNREPIGLSIGIVTSNSCYSSPDEFLKAADTAMYVAKKRGKGCYELVQHGLTA